MRLLFIILVIAAVAIRTYALKAELDNLKNDK